MRWLLILGLGVLGCGDDPPPTIGGSGDRTPIGNIGGPSSSGGQGGAGGQGGVGGQGGAGGATPKGACDTDSDFEAIDGASGSLRNIARDCGLFACIANVGNSVAYGACVSDCVEGRVTNLSTDCAGCYGDVERCGLSAFCRPKCQANTCSALCLSCLTDADCISDFEDCRGLPGNGCPS